MSVSVARQPIFNLDNSVSAYELLFRAGIDNAFNPNENDGTAATSSVLVDSFINVGIKTMTGGKRAFINFTEDLIINDYASLFPRENIVIELLENIEPTNDVIKACMNLKTSGYTLALDDFEYSKDYEPLIKLADIIKVDFVLSNEDTRSRLVEILAPRGKLLLAEKVESRDELVQAQKLGFALFQGYFFSKPVIIPREDIPESKTAHLMLIREINKPNTEIDDIAKIIKCDMSLSYRLLRFINSAFFGLSREVTSVKQALALLGLRNSRKWASLVALTAMTGQDTQQVTLISLIRARMCEDIANTAGMKGRSQEFFLMGLFSMIDTIMGRPMAEMLSEVSLASDIAEALMGESNRPGIYLKLITSYEVGDWDIYDESLEVTKIDSSIVSDIYFEAVHWAQQVMESGTFE